MYSWFAQTMGSSKSGLLNGAAKGHGKLVKAGFVNELEVQHPSNKVQALRLYHRRVQQKSFS